MSYFSEKNLMRIFAKKVKNILLAFRLKPVKFFPDGHFYSPIPSKIELEELKESLWVEEMQDGLAGIQLDIDYQKNLVKEFERFYSEIPFKASKKKQHRFFFENNSFEYTDAIILYGFLRLFNPQRVIEIGSGYSSALMLDTKDIFGLTTNFTFIEPYPKVLNSLLISDDKLKCEIIPKKVQKVDIKLFKELGQDDILFIDSSHVSKVGSDVNFEFFQILPNLKKGVIVHFHDIFYPFEYPKKWVYEGFNWNENYMLRAFLMFNDSFKVIFFNDYLHKKYSELFANMPLTYKNTGGSIWLRKIK